MSKICGTTGLGQPRRTYTATILCDAHLTGGECGMKRGLLILLLLLVCATTAGCTFYFGGWGTSSGTVFKAAVANEAPEALGCVQITYTSVSDPDSVWHGETDGAGRWTTSWLKIDKYIALFEHPECESRTLTVDVRDKGADNPVPPVHLAPKKSGDK